MTATIVTFVIYALIIIVITAFAYRRTHTHADYILGARSMNAAITAMGVAATDMSSWLMLSLPGVVYAFGLREMWLPVSLLVGSYLNWLIVAPRLRVYTEVASNSLTLPAFFEHRYAQDASYLRYTAAIIFVIFFTVYAASGLVGGAKLFVAAFDLEYHFALNIAAPIIIFYSVVGGYFAVNWIDLFQGTLMLFALVLIPVLAFGDFGGFEAITTTIHDIDPSHNNPFLGITVIGLLSSLSWGLGYFGQPHILVRFMSSENNRTITIGRRICITWMFFALLGAVAIGYVGLAYFPSGELHDVELVMPVLTERLLNPWLSAIVVAAIVSAVMSTVAAVLLAAGSSLVNDFYKRVINPKASHTQLVWLGRASVLVIACAALIMAHGNNPSVFKLVSHAWGGLGAAFGPVIIVSLFSARMTRFSALLGMIFGGGTALIWIICSYLKLGHIFTLYEILPGFIMAFIGIYIGYFFSKPNEQALKQFSDMKLALKK